MPRTKRMCTPTDDLATTDNDLATDINFTTDNDLTTDIDLTSGVEFQALRKEFLEGRERDREHKTGHASLTVPACSSSRPRKQQKNQSGDKAEEKRTDESDAYCEWVCSGKEKGKGAEEKQQSATSVSNSMSQKQQQ